MSEISFSGPVDVSPELMMALWAAMPPTGQSGVAQLFFSRFVTAPISDAALKAGAQVFFEREKINTAAAKALREGVAEKCRALGEKQANPEQIASIVNDEIRKAAAEFARGKVEAVIASIPLEALIPAANPAVLDAVRGLSQHYFLKTQNGQKAIMDLIELAVAESQRQLTDVIGDELDNRLSPKLAERLPKRGRPRKNANGRLDTADK